MTDEPQPTLNCTMDLTHRFFVKRKTDSFDEARADVIQAAYAEFAKARGCEGKMAAERQDHTLSSTALVNEVSMRMLSDANGAA